MSNNDLWPEVLRWIMAGLGAVAAALYGLIYVWINDRFKSSDERHDKHESNSSMQSTELQVIRDRVFQHETKIQVTQTHLEHLSKTADETKRGVDKLNEKLDAFIASNSSR